MIKSFIIPFSFFLQHAKIVKNISVYHDKVDTHTSLNTYQWKFFDDWLAKKIHLFHLLIFLKIENEKIWILCLFEYILLELTHAINSSIEIITYFIFDHINSKQML